MNGAENNLAVVDYAGTVHIYGDPAVAPLSSSGFVGLIDQRVRLDDDLFARNRECRVAEGLGRHRFAQRG